MKETIVIKNFKCFTDKNISLNDLTVLVGANGMGKSTVVQAILLLRHCIETMDSSTVELNGPYALALGSYESVLSKNAINGTISLSVYDNTDDVVASVEMSGSNEQFSYQMERTYRCFAKATGIGDDCFYFLSAERTGPRINQRIKELTYPNAGTYGEHAAQILADRYKKIDERRFHPKEQAPYLLAQVNAWLSEILPGNEVSSEANLKMQVAQVRLRNVLSDDYVEATNLGFGISYCLPIIINGLLAKKGCYMIVENPEAHLHPAAQTSMGKFLATIANCGVRVIVETHSDHILDGIQLYVALHKEFRESVIINNFGVGVDGKADVTPIYYNEKFEYTEWPRGFMDSSMLNYSELNNIRG